MERTVPSEDRNDSVTLCIALAPELLSAVVRQDGQVVAHSEMHTSNGHWRGALHLFDAYLRQSGVTLRGVPVCVSIAVRWCQLSMLPWSEALREPGSAAHYRHAHFVHLFGAAAQKWTVVCTDAPPGQARLACAIERDFCIGLRTIADELGHPGIVLESIVSPAARAVAVEQHQAFALIEPGRLVLAALAGRQVVAVQARDCRGPWEQELALAWNNWRTHAPELAEIAQLPLVSLDDSIGPLLEAPFASGYAAVTMIGCEVR